MIKRAPAVPVSGGTPAEPDVLTAKNPAPDTEPVPSVDIKKLKPEDLVPCERWEEVLEEFRNVNPAVAGSLDGSVAATAGNIIFITSQNRFFITLFKTLPGVDAGLAASIFHFGEVSIKDLKEKMAEQGIPVRL